MRALLFLAAARERDRSLRADKFLLRRAWLLARRSNGMVCRALNRPPADFNFAPFDALEIAVRSDNSIGAEVYFWPKAIDPARDYVLKLTFERGRYDEPQGEVHHGRFHAHLGA